MLSTDIPSGYGGYIGHARHLWCLGSGLAGQIVAGLNNILHILHAAGLAGGAVLMNWSRNTALSSLLLAAISHPSMGASWVFRTCPDKWTQCHPVWRIPASGPAYSSGFGPAALEAADARGSREAQNNWGQFPLVLCTSCFFLSLWPSGPL